MKTIGGKKLSLNRETLKNLNETSLGNVRGGAPQESVTRCGSDCCSEVVCTAAGVCSTDYKPPIFTGR